MKAIIIDDEHLAMESLEMMIEEYAKDIKIVGTASNIVEGAKLLNKLKPDVVFLDVEMPGGTGFDLLEMISVPDIKIVFTTAHGKYAIKAIKNDAIGYLLKPIDADELIDCINKIKKSLITNDVGLVKNKISLKTLDSIYILDVNNIIRCEADGGYTKVFIDSGECILVSRVLKEYEAKLSKHDFVRVHQSHLINLDHLVKLEKSEGLQVEMSDGGLIPVSSRKKETLTKMLENIS